MSKPNSVYMYSYSGSGQGARPGGITMTLSEQRYQSSVLFSNRGRGQPGVARISHILSRNFKAEFFVAI